MKRIEPEPWEKLLAGSPVRQGEAGFSKVMMRKVKERVEMRKRPRSRRWLVIGPVMAAVCAVAAVGLWKPEGMKGMLSQLSKPAEPVVLNQMDKQKEMTLKVAYDHESTFMSNYGKAFTIRYPNVDVKMTPMEANGYEYTKEKMIELIDKENPDILYLSPEMYRELAKEGRLYPLDAVMKQDKYDLQSLHSGVIDTLREIGGGKLYGLAPNYYMDALYYNKELFDKYGVPYPKDKMSWEETLQLAARFPTDGKPEERVYGLVPSYFDNAPQLAEQIGKTKGMSFISPDGKQATINTDSWKQVWNTALDAYRKGYVFQRPPRSGNIKMEDYFKSNPFIMGKAAMALADYTLKGNLQTAAAQYNTPSFAWDIVTEPVDPARPDESSTFRMGPIYAVNAKSDNLRPAWEMIKLINSEEIAKKLDKTFGGNNLSIQVQLTKSDASHNFAPFYSMKPSQQLDSGLQPQALRKFNDAFMPKAAEQAKAVMEGRTKLDDGLKQMQEDAQKALLDATADDRK